MENAIKKPSESSSRTEVVALGGGCFWCTEAVFSLIKGVVKVVPGYSGGYVSNPTYEQVSTGETGHAEVVEVTFDPDVISFREILEMFFGTHDPTTLNSQGADVGSQYRSIILYRSEEQRRVAQELISELDNEKLWKGPIVTEVKPFERFYEAEEYHKDYFKKHPEQAYCRVVIAPKIAKMQKTYLQKLKAPIG